MKIDPVTILFDVPGRCFLAGFLVGLAADPHLPWPHVAAFGGAGLVFTFFAMRDWKRTL